MIGDSPNLKTTAQTVARANRYLSENAEEDDRIVFTLQLPKANVNDWKEGQYAQVKFSHLRTDALDLSDVHERPLRAPHRRPGRGDGRLLQRRLRMHADARRARRARPTRAWSVSATRARPACRAPRRPATCCWRSCSRPATRPASRPPSGPSTTRPCRPLAATPPFSDRPDGGLDDHRHGHHRLQGPEHRRALRAALRRAVPRRSRDVHVGPHGRCRVAARRARRGDDEARPVLDGDHRQPDAHVPVGAADVARRPTARSSRPTATAAATRPRRRCRRSPATASRRSTGRWRPATRRRLADRVGLPGAGSTLRGPVQTIPGSHARRT